MNSNEAKSNANQQIESANSLFREYQALRKSLRSVADQVFLTPELKPVIELLLKSEANMRDFVNAAPKNVLVNMEVTTEPLDYLQNSDSAMEMLRRQKAKDLARRIYPKVHPDRVNGALYGLHDVRLLAKEGEIEVLHMIAAHVGVAVVRNTENHGDGTWEQVVYGLRVRIQKLRSTPAFKLSYLYNTNRVGFFFEAKQVLLRKVESLNNKLDDLIETLNGGMEEAEGKKGKA